MSIQQREHLDDHNDPTRCDGCGHKIGYAKSVIVDGKILHDMRPNYSIGECNKAY